MTNRAWPFDAVSSAPSYTGRALRQTGSPAIGGATSARPLGGRSGVRPGTPTTTVTASSTVWTVLPHAGVLDVETAAEASVYWYATDANNTGAVTAASAVNPRKDIIYVKLDDPAEADGSSVPAVTVAYLAGTAAASPVAPATPARSMVIAEINVPISGGGSPTVSWKAPYAVAAGGVIPVRTAAERNTLTASATAENPIVVDRLDLGLIERSVGAGWAPIGSPAFMTATNSTSYSMGANSTMYVLGGPGASAAVFGAPTSYAPLTLASGVYSNDIFSWDPVNCVLSPVQATGMYEIEFRMQASAVASGTVTIGIVLNATSIGTAANDLARDDRPNQSVTNYMYAKTRPVRLVAGNQIRFISFLFGAPGAVTIGVDPNQTWFNIRRVGA